MTLVFLFLEKPKWGKSITFKGNIVASSGGATGEPISHWCLIPEAPNAVQRSVFQRGANGPNAATLSDGKPDVISIRK
jgi:hypothetical protein